MIRLQDGTILNDNQYVIKEQFDGINLLTFTLPEDVFIHNEDVVFETIDRQEYLVKVINGDNITCELNLDGLKAQQTDFDNGSATAGSTLTKALSGTGWTGVDYTGLTTKRTIRGAYTPFDVIKKIAETWDGVTPLYDNTAKKVTLVFPDKNEAKETFLTEDLNLRQLDIAGDSSTFCTRLRAKGRDGLTFADINGGKDYVENYTYSNKVIYGQMIEDDRFLVKENLKEYAEAKLAEMAVPAVSYECDVVDVAAYDSDYSFLEIKMHKAVWLLDKRRNTRIQHRVVAYERHPANPENNKVTLATVINPLQKSVKSIEEMLNDPNSEFVQKFEIYVDTTADNATNWLLGAKGGNVIFRKNSDGQPEAIIIADGLDLNTAKNVWLWNKNGLGFSPNGINGPYTTAITSDGKISADFIKAGKMSADYIQGGTIDADQINVKNLNADNINSGALKGNYIADGAIWSSKLYDGAVTTDKLGSYAVDSGNIATDAIINRHLTSGSVQQSTCSTTLQNLIAEGITAKSILTGAGSANDLTADYFKVTTSFRFKTFSNPLTLYNSNNLPKYVLGTN